jgi:hypothetical protein
MRLMIIKRLKDEAEIDEGIAEPRGKRKASSLGSMTPVAVKRAR